jgi:hypothetical protein
MRALTSIAVTAVCHHRKHTQRKRARRASTFHPHDTMNRQKKNQFAPRRPSIADDFEEIIKNYFAVSLIFMLHVTQNNVNVGITNVY